MKKMKFSLLSLLFAVSFISSEAIALDRGDLKEKSNDAATVLDEVMKRDLTAIPDVLLDKATCVAVYPNVLKLGFVGAFETGRGVASCRTADGWSAPIYTNITGVSFGFQLGIKKTDLVLVFVNTNNAVENLSTKNVSLGADASIAAGPLGRDLRIGTDIQIESEIYSYSRSRGAFAGVALEGAVLYPFKRANELLYGTSQKADLMKILKSTDLITGTTEAFTLALETHAEK